MGKGFSLLRNVNFHENLKKISFFYSVLDEIVSLFLLFSQFSVFSVYAESTFYFKFNGTLEQ